MVNEIASEKEMGRTDIYTETDRQTDRQAYHRKGQGSLKYASNKAGVGSCLSACLA
jgi:hypothetical protein